MTTDTAPYDFVVQVNHDEMDHYKSWIKGIEASEDIHARDVPGDDDEMIAIFVMEGVINNDDINNDGEPYVWDDADTAMSVYCDNMGDDDQPIVWDATAIEFATEHVRKLMLANGNLKP